MTTHSAQLLNVGDHLAPLVITGLVFLVLLMVFIGIPYVNYIRLVANAKDEEGINELAQYLAKNTGGKRINVDHTWESFIPAATELHDSFITKALKIHFHQ